MKKDEQVFLRLLKKCDLELEKNDDGSYTVSYRDINNEKQIMNGADDITQASDVFNVYFDDRARLISKFQRSIGGVGVWESDGLNEYAQTEFKSEVLPTLSLDQQRSFEELELFSLPDADLDKAVNLDHVLKMLQKSKEQSIDR